MTEGQDHTPITISIRAAKRQRELIDLAADQLGRSREGFMLDAASREAEHILLDKVFFLLGTPAYNQFLAILDNPPPPNEHLRRLMAMKAPWE
jgi:uncharacterized protein (DUF1778 family)